MKTEEGEFGGGRAESVEDGRVVRRTEGSGWTLGVLEREVWKK